MNDRDGGKIEKIIETAEPILKSTSDAICITDVRGNRLYTNSLYDIMCKRGSTEMVADSRSVYIDGMKVANVVVYHDLSEINRLRRELEKLSQKLRKVETKIGFSDIVGTDKALLAVINNAKIAAMTPATIMLRGESGTGKEIFANAIHNMSPRRNEKFVKINCSSIPEELLESELFGYKEGAFTGAQRGGKRGLFHEANRGTIFLDEIGDISPKMQVKILRALQEKEIMPVGSTETINIDVRVICATNKSLEDMVETGEFREDLYYRLNVFPLKIPPLRERKNDIAPLADHIINKYNDFYDRHVQRIEPEAIRELQMRDWPGNVRELENVLSRALVNLSREEDILTKDDILAALGETPKRSGKGKEHGKNHETDFLAALPQDLHEAVMQTEKQCIIRAMEKYNGDKNKAAVELGIPLRTLYYKCNKLGIAAR